MCGLVGVLSPTLTDQHRRSFFQNLIFDTVRGEDSTGVAIVNNLFADNGDVSVDIYKTVGTPSDLLRYHPEAKKLTSSLGQIFMGHNRAATQGAVTIENAHPFEFEHVVGMHNGTIPKFNLWDFDGYKKFDVDSQIVLNELDKRPIADVWPEIDGAATLVWLDKRDKSLNFARNAQRPLYFTPTEDNNGMYWSSEPMFARMGAIRAGVKIKDSFEVKINNHYRFVWNSEQKAIVMEVTPLRPFVPKVTYSTGYRTGYEGGANTYYNGGSYSGLPRTPPKSNVFKGGNRDKKNGFANNFIIDDLVCDDFRELTGHIELVGTMPSGKTIIITIPNSLRVAKKKTELRAIIKRIMDRHPQDGQYYCAKITAAPRGNDCFTASWEQCHWVPNTNNKKVYVKDTTTGGYRFMTQMEIDAEYKRVQQRLRDEDEGVDLLEDQRPSDEDYQKMTAPWHEPHMRLSHASYMNRIAGGCCSCNKTLTWGEREQVLWIDKDLVVCADCKHEPWVEEAWQTARNIVDGANK